MFSSFDEAHAINAPSQQSEMSDGVRFARYRMLEELPGLVFGLMALAYVVMSLAGLAP
jgi:hypothetical protein